jgi:glycosyltransferase involved in cell wall biosynthesis
LRILIVSGIWPPDIGGPASHGPDLGRFLVERGHVISAVASAGRGAVRPDFPLRTLDREARLPIRLVTGAAGLLDASRRADVVYATGIYARSSLAARATGVPLVMKLVNDPAFERARSLGWHRGSLESFQPSSRDARLVALKALRATTLAVPRRFVVPSRYLAGFVEGWGVARDRIEVVPNPEPDRVPPADREALRARLGLTGPTAVFAGRFVAQKDLPTLIAAFSRVREARLVLVGEGPERDAAERRVQEAGLVDRVRFEPATSRSGAMEWMQAADVAVLASSWENYPHAVAEAFAVGTPVIATAVGGVPEMVAPDVNGLLVPPGDPEAFGSAVNRLFGDPALLESMRRRIRAAPPQHSEATVFGRLEGILQAAAGSTA